MSQLEDVVAPPLPSFPQLNLESIDAHFPMQHYREGQREAIEFAVKSFNNGKMIVILECPTGSGKCLDGDTLILARDGTRIPIKNLGQHIGLELHSLNDDLHNCSGTLSDHVYSGQKECVKLTTRLGKQLVCTHDHIFLTMSGWKPLKEIRVGDHIATNRSLSVNSQIDLMTVTEAKIIGFMLGDGTFSKYTPSVCINDKEKCRQFGSVKRWFQVLLTKLDSNLRLSGQSKRTAPSYRIVANEHFKNLVPNEAAKLFEKHKLTGVTKHDKFIPDLVYQSKQNIWIAVLIGLWQSDGWACIKQGKHNRQNYLDIGFSNISRHLVAGIQHLLLRLGILSKSRWRNSLNSTTGKRYPSWQLKILTESQKIFLDLIGDSITKIDLEPLKHVAEHSIGNNTFQVPGDVWKTITTKVSDSDLSWNSAAPYGFKSAGPAMMLQRESATSRKTVAHFGQQLNDHGLLKLANADILWDEIISLDMVGLRDVYDIQVIVPDDEPSMSANDIITHNSPIGMTLADMVDTSYYLTITKILQDQLVTDFGNQIVDLKGRNAYPCTFYKRHGQRLVDNKLWTPDILTKLSQDATCGNGYCRTKWNKNSPQDKKYNCSSCFLTDGVAGTGRPKGNLTNLPPGMRFSACPYYEQVHKAIRSRKVVMNFSSFLYQTQMTNRFDEPRNLMIIDECHNVESQLLSFVSFSITDQYLKKEGVYIPEFEHAMEYAIWMEDAQVSLILLEAVKQARIDDKPKLEEELTRVLKKYKMFMDHIADGQDEWVCEYEEKSDGKGGISHRRITLKPVFAQKFAHKLLFGFSQRILMMSATVLDVNVICRSLGIDRSHVAALRVKNRFPKENRPIYIRPVAKMTGGKSRMNEWAPLLVDGVNKIVNEFTGKKGIVHTHNFAIMDHLLKRCAPAVKKRFIHQREFDNDKQVLLAEHARRSDSVIIAPAMHEGIDLVDDLSRFQIICKVPYANCFDDEQLARRVEVDRPYYTWLTALKLVQSYGRSIRSETDYADTFILDEAIYKFMRDADSMLPGWFKEAIHDEGDGMAF